MSSRSRALALVVTIFALSAIRVDCLPTISANRDHLLRVVRDLSGTHPALAEQVKQIYRNQQPVFVFVPGILGSKLTNRDGVVVWGEKNFTNGMTHDLAYPPPAFHAEVMDSFKIFNYEQDVYGGMMRAVKELDVPGVDHWIPFGYDWRADLADSARHFDDFLRSPASARQIQGRKIVVIAHSMGGLVVRYWYAKYYTASKTPYPFSDIASFVYVGTPHRGAVSMLGALLSGYSPSDDANSFEHRVLARFFNDLNAAAFTFPSLFELLPRDVRFVDKDRREINIFDQKDWERLHWGQAVMGNEPPSLFYARLGKLLKQAKDFQAVLDAAGPTPKSHYIYAGNFKTPVNIARDDRGEFKAQSEESAGDGRVTIASALNKPGVPDPNVLTSAFTEHGALPSDARFLEHVKAIRDLYQLAANTALMALAEHEPALRAAMLRAGYVLPIPLQPAAGQREAANAIAAFDMALLRERGIDADDVYRVASSKDKAHPTDAAQLYALYLTANPAGLNAHWAAQNLTYALVRTGRHKAATEIGKLALAKTPPFSSPEEVRAARAITCNNLGVALKEVGRTIDAARAFHEAVKFDPSSKARENLMVLGVTPQPADHP